MPFSPRWLIHHNREEEARAVLANLRGLSADNELVELEFLEIKAQSLFEKRTVSEKFPALSQQTTWNTFKLQFVAIKSLFESKPMFKRVIVATVTIAHQQFTGNVARYSYLLVVANVVKASTRFSTMRPQYSSSWVSVATQRLC